MAYASQVNRLRANGCIEENVIYECWEAVTLTVLDLSKEMQDEELHVYFVRRKQFEFPGATGCSPDTLSERGYRLGSNHVCASFLRRHALGIQPPQQYDRWPPGPGCDGTKSLRWYTPPLVQIQTAHRALARIAMTLMPEPNELDVPYRWQSHGCCHIVPILDVQQRPHKQPPFDIAGRQDYRPPFAES